MSWADYSWRSDDQKRQALADLRKKLSHEQETLAAASAAARPLWQRAFAVTRSDIALLEAHLGAVE